MNAVVVHRGRSRFGLEQLHVMQDAPLDVMAWIRKAEAEAMGRRVEVQTWFMYEEESLGIHHLHLYWREFEQEVNCGTA